MKAMLLAAGLGTRLKPITDHTPKPLVEVDGLPLIFYNLALLKKYGVTDVVINLHHLGSQIKKTLGDGSRFGFKFYYSTEKVILGTAGGIFKAKRFLQDGPFLVVNGDIITDLDLRALAKAHAKNRSLATLVVKQSRLADEYGTLYVDRKGKMGGLLAKPASGRWRKTFFTGMHVIDPSFFSLHSKKGFSCIVRDYYVPQLTAGQPLSGFFQTDYWNDLGTLPRLQATDRAMKEGKIKLSYGKELRFFREVLRTSRRLASRRLASQRPVSQSSRLRRGK